jgi:steroid delta-isomerase-like uncharacterized protein
MSEQAAAVVQAYYEAFNRGDWAGMVALLTDDVAHDINQGTRETGREPFRRFLAHMERCYREELRDIVVLTEHSGERAAAEFVVHGTYLLTDSDLPPAKGQTYVLPACAFFTLRAGRISRISNYYNLRDWLRQVR